MYCVKAQLVSLQAYKYLTATEENKTASLLINSRKKISNHLHITVWEFLINHIHSKRNTYH